MMLRPEHISAYSLILEEGTPLYDRYEKGELELPDEDTDREMYRETKRILARAGYERYEISNYAKKGYECRHNCGYWQRKDYAGFGIGAASLVENVRFRNGADLLAYLAAPLGCREDEQVLGRQEQMEEFMFLGLRMRSGVDCGEFRRLFGCGIEEVYGEVIRKNAEDGLLRYLPGDGESPRVGTSMSGDREAPSAGISMPGDREAPRAGTGVPGDRESPHAGIRMSADNMRLALTDRGLDLSNYVMAQFLN